jgi:CheY-like chemotaxis protein
VVEREPEVARAVAAILGRAGHRVATAARAEDALGNDDCDVLVCAVELDGMDGLELLAALRRRGSSSRAVLMTSLPNLEDCRRALRLGAAELLVKPLDPRELLAAVEDAPPAPLPADALPFRRSFGATIEEAELAVRDLVGQLVRWGVGPTARARIATAAVEVLDNAVRHAYPDRDAGGPIELLARCTGREVELDLRDRGVGFDARGEGGRALGDPAQSGLARAAALCEGLRVTSAPGPQDPRGPQGPHGTGTRVELCFTAYRTNFDERGSIDLTELDWLTPGMARRVIDMLRAGDAAEVFQLSPAMAVTVGRLLSRPPRGASAQEALWSPA